MNLNSSSAAALTEVRVNALLAMLQQQRDSALNQLVLLNAELATARNELQQLQQLVQELQQPREAAVPIPEGGPPAPLPDDGPGG